MADLGPSPFTITADGNYSIPEDVTSLQVECWGWGGDGGDAVWSGVAWKGQGGGGGGAYARRNTMRVIPGTIYHFACGFASVSFTDEDGLVCKADYGEQPVTGHGEGGAGGHVVDSIGDVRYAGGNGGYAFDTINNAGAGGGSSAGTGAAGDNGDNVTSSSGSAGGTAPAGGGNGGRGGDSGTNAGKAAGASPGGGGGGSAGVAYGLGAAGAAGKIVVTYTLPPSRTYKRPPFAMPQMPVF